MILKEYIKRKDDNEGCNVIDTSYNSIKNASNKTQYLFFKLKFNNLIKETEIMKLQFLLNYYKIQNNETITIYETSLTSIDDQTISNFVNEIDTSYFPKRKEYVFEDTKDDNEAIHSAVFDLKELDFELSSNKDTIVFMLKFNFTIDDRLQSLIDDQELNYDCYALLTKSTISLNQYSKIDTYDLDGNAKIIVDNKNGELFTSLDLISTMSNKNPISLSLIGNRENYFNEELFLKPLRFTFLHHHHVF